MRPLRNRLLLSSTDVIRIFGNLETLYNFNHAFLNRLQQVWPDWSTESQVGSILQEFVSKPSSYGSLLTNYFSYFNNYRTVAQTTLSVCEKDDAFCQFREEANYHDRVVEQGLNLSKILELPFQRVHCYSELFANILNNTPAEHPDHGVVKKANSELSQVLDRIEQALAKQASETLVAAEKENRHRKKSPRKDFRLGRKRRTEQERRPTSPGAASHNNDCAEGCDSEKSHRPKAGTLTSSRSIFSKHTRKAKTKKASQSGSNHVRRSPPHTAFGHRRTRTVDGSMESYAGIELSSYDDLQLLNRSPHQEDVSMKPKRSLKKKYFTYNKKMGRKARTRPQSPTSADSEDFRDVGRAYQPSASAPNLSINSSIDSSSSRVSPAARKQRSSIVIGERLRRLPPPPSPPSPTAPSSSRTAASVSSPPPLSGRACQISPTPESRKPSTSAAPARSSYHSPRHSPSSPTSASPDDSRSLSPCLMSDTCDKAIIAPS